MKRWGRLTGALMLLPLVLVACLVTPTQRREDTLTREARTYNDDMRWGRYEQIAQSLSALEAQQLLARASAIGDELAMGDYEILSIIFAPGSEAATVVAKFDWYSKRVSTLRSTTLEERWEFKDGRWLVTKQRRVRGDRFPLLPEAVGAPPEAAATPEAATTPDGGA